MRSVPASLALREQCINLRLTERLSLRGIAERTGAAKGTLSGWLKPYPLSDEEKAAHTSAARQRDLACGKVWGHQPKPRPPRVASFSSEDWDGLPTADKGFVSELAVMTRLSKLRVTIFRPASDCSRCDMIAMLDDGATVKIQVKTVRYAKSGIGMPFIFFQKSNGRGVVSSYRKCDFDILVGYDPRCDVAYVLTWANIKNNATGVSVKSEYAEAWSSLDEFKSRP